MAHSEASLERRRQYRREMKGRWPSQQRRIDENRELVRNAKDVSCADCGGYYPHYVMDFDHRDPATKSFAIGGTQTRATATVQAEIDKCDVVCANCHRERTHRARAGDASPVVAATI